MTDFSPALWFFLCLLSLLLVVQILSWLRPRPAALDPQMRAQMQAQLQELEHSLEQLHTSHAQLATRLEQMGTDQQQQAWQAAQTRQQQGEQWRQWFDGHASQSLAEARSARQELQQMLHRQHDAQTVALRTLGQDQTQALASLAQSLTQSQQSSTSSLQDLLQTHMAQALHETRASREEVQQQLHQQRDAQAASLHTFGQQQSAELRHLGQQLRDALHQQATVQEQELRRLAAELAQSQQAARAELQQQLHQQQEAGERSAQHMRHTLNERLAAIQQDNAARLEAMRRTVDEKLHDTLEQRLGASFKLVSDRLEQVHRGLGEMQTLAGSVGDLKRVMTNVKTRGTWGEVQLGAIIDNVLTPEQYARNVRPVPGGTEVVEFAIRLPGRGKDGRPGQEDAPVWLPIDAKYPVEHYQRLQDALDAGDRETIATAAQAFETSIRTEARKIAVKYIAVPHTTDFAVMYLPTESLFAEVLRRPGLVEALQSQHRIVVTGPANLAAMLNSLQMGFRTLAIEQRSLEVWTVLGHVKTEFAKFGDVVDATRKSIDAAARKFEQVGVRTRAIERKLRSVQELPTPADTAPDDVLPLLPPDTHADANTPPGEDGPSDDHGPALHG